MLQGNYKVVSWSEFANAMQQVKKNILTNNMPCFTNNSAKHE